MKTRTKTTKTRTKKTPSKKRIGNSLWLALACALCLCPAGVVSAGQRSASPEARTIEGTVLDNAGKVVPGAVVLLEDLKSLQVRSYLVQQDGKYHFHGLSSDASYQLRAQKNGLFSGAKTVTVFNNGRTVVVNLKIVVKKPRTPGNSS